MSIYNPIRSVDGVEIPTPSSYAYKLDDVSASDAGRTEDVMMHKKRIGQVVGIELAWNYINDAQVSAILKAFDPEYITVEYKDAKENSFVTDVFYVGNRQAPMYNARMGLWTSLSFNLIRRSGQFNDPNATDYHRETGGESNERNNQGGTTHEVITADTDWEYLKKQLHLETATRKTATNKLQMEPGSIKRSTGFDEDGDGYQRSNYIKLDGAGEYTFKCSDNSVTMVVFQYDADKTPITGWNSGYTYARTKDGGSVELTGYYARFRVESTENLTFDVLDKNGVSIVTDYIDDPNGGEDWKFQKVDFIDNHQVEVEVIDDDPTMHQMTVSSTDNEFCIVAVKPKGPKKSESTLALSLGGRGLVDLSCMRYHDDKPAEFGIVLQSRHSNPLPYYYVAFNDGKGAGRIRKFQIDPDAVPVFFTAEGIKIRKDNQYNNDYTADDFITMRPDDFAASKHKADEIVSTASGSTAVITDGSESNIRSFTIYGKSTQDGTPSPDNPVEIKSVGDGGSVDVFLHGKNLFNISALTDVVTPIYSLHNAGDGSIILTSDVPGRPSISNEKFRMLAPSVRAGDTIYIDAITPKIRYVFFGGTKRVAYFNYPFNVQKEDLDGYFALYGGVANSDAVVKDIIISRSNDTKYEPYKPPQTVTIPTTLRGIPVSSGGNVTIDGQQYISDVLTVNSDGSGKIEQNIVPITPTSYGKNSTHFYTAPIDDISENTMCICTVYKCLQYGEVMSDKTALISPNDKRIYIIDNDYATANDFNTANASKITFWYFTSSPVIVNLAPEQVQAILSLHTYKPTTVISNDQGAHMEVGYVADPKNYIDGKFQELTNAIAALGTV